MAEQTDMAFEVITPDDDAIRVLLTHASTFRRALRWVTPVTAIVGVAAGVVVLALSRLGVIGVITGSYCLIIAGLLVGLALWDQGKTERGLATRTLLRHRGPSATGTSTRSTLRRSLYSCPDVRSN